jgi:hypothetical protein
MPQEIAFKRDHERPNRSRAVTRLGRNLIAIVFAAGFLSGCVSQYCGPNYPFDTSACSTL